MANLVSTHHTGKSGAGGGPAGTNSQQRPSSRTSSSLPPNPHSDVSLSVPNRIPLPQHFIVRPGSTKHTASGTVTVPGPIVPLVAVDQLPEWLDLFGVPRELSVEQTVGLSNLGTVVRKPEYYQVYLHSNVQLAPATRSRPHRGQKHHTRTGGAPSQNTSGLLIPVDSSTPSTSTSASAPSSTASSSASTETAPTPNPRIEPAAKALASSSTHDQGNKAGGNNRGGSGSSSKEPAHPNPTTAVPHPQLPYALIHPSAQIYTPMQPTPHHPSLPRPPRTSSLHPADRLLQSWYPGTLGSPYSRPSTHKPSSSSVGGRHKIAANSSSSSTANTTNATSVTNAGTGGGGRTTTTATGAPSHAAGTVSSIYCRHWCHRGTCRWGGQCRYAHAMPGTAEGLRDVGLAHPPAWYTTAVSMAFGPGGFAAGGVGGRGGAAAAVPTTAVVPTAGGSGSGSVAVGGVGGGGAAAAAAAGVGGSVSSSGIWYLSPQASQVQAPLTPVIRHNGSGSVSGKKTAKDREREKSKEKDKEGLGKGKGVENKVAGDGVAELDVSQQKKDMVEGQGNVAADQGQRQPEQRQEDQKLVEI